MPNDLVSNDVGEQPNPSEPDCLRGPISRIRNPRQQKPLKRLHARLNQRNQNRPNTLTIRLLKFLHKAYYFFQEPFMDLFIGQRFVIMGIFIRSVQTCRHYTLWKFIKSTRAWPHLCLLFKKVCIERIDID